MVEDEHFKHLRSYGLDQSERFLQEKDADFKLSLFKEISMKTGEAVQSESAIKDNKSLSPTALGWRRPLVWSLAAIALLVATISIVALNRDNFPEVEPAATGASDEMRPDKALTLSEIVIAVEDPDFFTSDEIPELEGPNSMSRQLALILHEDVFIEQQPSPGDAVVDEDLLNTKVLELEEKFSKQEIVDMYLDEVYLGSGYYGVENASMGYWNKAAEDLEVCEQATLAGIIKQPTLYSPDRNPQQAAARRDEVLDVLISKNLLKEDKIGCR